ncbi:MAG: nucleotidyltransferase family protein [Pseudonocardiaceae bacterium]
MRRDPFVRDALAVLLRPSRRGRGRPGAAGHGPPSRSATRAAEATSTLVELEPGRSLFDLGGLLTDLRDLLGGSVDVVTPAALQQRIRTTVVRKAAPL